MWYSARAEGLGKYDSLLVLWQGLSTCLFSLSLIFIQCFAGTAKIAFGKSFFFGRGLIFTRSCIMAGIKSSVCISKSQEIVCILFSRKESGLCMYHLVMMVKFMILPQFYVDHPLHQVVSSLILFLRWFAVFANYVINCFVSIITKPSLAILLRIIYFWFNAVGLYGVVLCSY